MIKKVKYRTIDFSHIKTNKQMEEAQKQFALFENEIKKGMYVDNENLPLKNLHKNGLLIM